MFKDGALVQPAELMSSLHDFPVTGSSIPTAVGESRKQVGLQQQHQQQQHSLSAAARERLLCRVLASVLCASGVLPRLLAVQQLDVLDVEGAAALVERLVGEAEAGVDGQQKQQKKKQQQQQQQQHGQEQPHPLRLDPSHLKSLADATSDLASIPREAALQLVRAYLTAVTAKDCAIMVTLQQVERGDGSSGSSRGDGSSGDGRSGDCEGLLFDAPTGCSFLWRLNLVDLDLKPLAKVNAARGLA